MNFKEFITLLPVALVSMFLAVGVKMRELIFYGSRIWWWKLNALLMYFYSIDPAHKIMARNMKTAALGKENLIYGETPLFTLRKILHRVAPQEHDVFIDLGCGRGLPCFYAHFLYGLTAVGIDIIPEFAARALDIIAIMKIEDVHIIQNDFMEADLSRGTIFYIAGTTFDQDTLTRLSRRIESIPGRKWIISLSCSLPSPLFKTIHVDDFWFSWGKSRVYFQVKD